MRSRKMQAMAIQTISVAGAIISIPITLAAITAAVQVAPYSVRVQAAALGTESKEYVVDIQVGWLCSA